MLYSILFIVIIGIFCLFKTKEYVIGLNIILLPFHVFIKRCFEVYGGSAGLFPLWREIALTALFIKVIKDGSLKIPRLGLLFCILIIDCYFYTVGDEMDAESALAILRLYLLCFITYISFSNIRLSIDEIKVIIKSFLIVLILMCITGYIERFLIYTPYHIFMEHYETTRSGMMVFKMPSYLIMGNIPRMCGFVNGPNQFGVTIAFILSIVLYCIWKLPNLKSRKICISIFLLGTSCLLLSFSRAGWFILIATVLMMLHYRNKSIFSIAIKVSVFLIGLLIVGYYIMPDSFEVVTSSLSGNEGSAAGRQGEISYAIDKIMSEPFGHGLGSARSNEETLTESAHLILMYEIGIWGFFFYFVFYIMNLVKNKSRAGAFTLIFPLCLCSILCGFVSVNFDEAPFMFFFWALLGLSQNERMKEMIEYDL